MSHDFRSGGGIFMVIEAGQKMYAADILNLTFFPIGTILQFSGSQYSRLTAARTEDNKVIWTVCNGVGVNGIPVPNLVDKFLRGADSDSVILQTVNLPSHNHGATGLSLGGLNVSGLSVNSSNSTHEHILSGKTTSVGHGHSISDSGHSHTISFYSGHDNPHSGVDTNALSNGHYVCSSGGGTNSSVIGVSITGDGAHEHSFSSDSKAFMGGSHTHGISGSITGGTISGSTANVGSGQAFSVDTVPAYYTVIYIMKVA
jgi:hypothetical protein